MCAVKSLASGDIVALSFGATSIWPLTDSSECLGWKLESRLCRFLRARYPSALGVLLLLSLLAPYSSGFLVGFRLSEPACKMECCRKSKICGRRERKAQPREPDWERSFACCQSCALVLSLPRPKTAALPSSTIETLPYGLELCLVFCTQASGFVPATTTVLFQRPPPQL